MHAPTEAGAAVTVAPVFSKPLHRGFGLNRSNSDWLAHPKILPSVR
jgi:hypothetical protein